MPENSKKRYDHVIEGTDRSVSFAHGTEFTHPLLAFPIIVNDGHLSYPGSDNLIMAESLDEVLLALGIARLSADYSLMIKRPDGSGPERFANVIERGSKGMTDEPDAPQFDEGAYTHRPRMPGIDPKFVLPNHTKIFHPKWHGHATVRNGSIVYNNQLYNALDDLMHRRNIDASAMMEPEIGGEVFEVQSPNAARRYLFEVIDEQSPLKRLEKKPEGNPYRHAPDHYCRHSFELPHGTRLYQNNTLLGYVDDGSLVNMNGDRHAHLSYFAHTTRTRADVFYDGPPPAYGHLLVMMQRPGHEQPQPLHEWIARIGAEQRAAIFAQLEEAGFGPIPCGQIEKAKITPQAALACLKDGEMTPEFDGLVEIYRFGPRAHEKHRGTLDMSTYHLDNIRVVVFTPTRRVIWALDLGLFGKDANILATIRPSMERAAAQLRQAPDQRASKPAPGAPQPQRREIDLKTGKAKPVRAMPKNNGKPVPEIS